MSLQAVLYGVMILSGLIMLVTHQHYRSKGASWARVAAAVAGTVVVLCAVGAIAWQLVKGDIEGVAREKRRQRLAEVKMKVLGEYLAATYGRDGGRTVVPVIAVDGMSAAAIDPIALAGLEQGLDGRLPLGDTVQLGNDMTIDPNNPGDMESMAGMGVMEIFTVEKLDEIAATHPADILLLFNDLPMNYREAKLWTMPPGKRPILVLLGSMQLTDEFIHKALAEGNVGAVLVSNPDAPYSEKPPPLPEADQEVFSRYFLLITPQNVAEAIGKYPSLFGRYISTTTTTTE